MRYRKITQHKITSDCAGLIIPIPNLHYRGMVKSDPVINGHQQITLINYQVKIYIHNIMIAGIPFVLAGQLKTNTPHYIHFF
jgi:hypothetical protein